MSQTGPPKAATASASASVPSVVPNVSDRHVTKNSRKRPHESSRTAESVGSKTIPNNISLRTNNNNNNNNNSNSNNVNSHNRNNSKTMNNNSNKNCGVDSEYCQRDIVMDTEEDSNGVNQFNVPSTSKILSGVRPLSQQYSESESSTQQTLATQNTEMAHKIFARCFNQTFHKKDLPGYNKVLAYDSDGMEDSD